MTPVSLQRLLKMPPVTGSDVSSHCNNLELNNMNPTHVPKIRGFFFVVKSPFKVKVSSKHKL